MAITSAIKYYLMPNIKSSIFSKAIFKNFMSQAARAKVCRQKIAKV
jgi:hypothetical protein